MSDGAPLLDFEAWSDLAARMVKRDEAGRAAVLAQEGIDPAAWARCDEHYNRVIVDDVVNDRRGRREAYGRKCSEELARRRAEAANVTPAPGVSEAPEPPAPPSLPAASSDEPAPITEVSRAAPEPPPVIAPRPVEIGKATAVFQAPMLARPSDPLPFGGKPTLDPVSSKPSGLPHPGSGSTLPLGLDLMAHARKALPFAGLPGVPSPATPAAPAEQAPPSRLSLQSYASLCAELAAYPANRAAILARYGIADEAAYRALDHEWQARIADPEVRSRWQQSYATYADWLRQQAR
jgi:hypothetical protein